MDPRKNRGLILKKVIDRVEFAKKSGLAPLIVFDLDSTLFCVSPRIQSILNSLAQDTDLLQQFPQFTPRLTGLEVKNTDWGIRTVLTRAKVLGTLDFFESVRYKWAELFFSSQFLEKDIPYPGAVEYVQKLATFGAEIRYLTGRDWPRMGDGTLKSLKTYGFPLQTPEHLHMKSESSRHDADFKLEILRHLQVENPEICFFENEPVIVNLIHRQLPSLPLVFVKSVHSGRENAPDHLPAIEPNYEMI